MSLEFAPARQNRSADGQQIEAVLVTDSEVARLLGISRATVWRRVKDATLPAPVRIGPNTTRFVRQEILDAVARAMVGREEGS